MLSGMEWDELFDTGRLWRVRVQLLDRPGALATLTRRLAADGANLLAVSVLPLGTESGDEVIDEFVLRAPEALPRGDLIRMVEADGSTCIGLTPAEAGELVDAETAVLRAAAAALDGRTSTAEALRRVLGADSVTAIRSVVDDDGNRVAFILPDGRRVLAERTWTPFTGGELARAAALLELIEARAPIAEPELPLTPRPPATTGPARQLSALDTLFLDVETPTSQTHVGNLLVLDPAAIPGGRLTGAALREIFANRIHLIPALRWRLRTVPLGLDLPYWEDAHYVDLHHHVREIALPAPGTDAQLADLIGTLAARPLDRRFPLWEAYLVSGLRDGRQALYAKVHHAVVDGVSGAEVLAAILDLTPEPMTVPIPTVGPTLRDAPALPTMLARGVVATIARPARALRAAPSLLRHLRPLIRPVPATPFNRAVGADRSFTYTSLPLADVKAAKDALGGTVNDVVMALCTTALRRWLIAHDTLPADPLVAAVPVSVRTAETAGTGGNQISLMQIPLPTHIANPLARVDLLRSVIRDAKQQGEQAPRTLLHSAADALPHVFGGLIVRALVALTTPTNLVVSNVPGPQIPLYAAGARVTGCFPVSLVSDVSGGINITVMSYCGSLDVGIVACPELVPDVATFTGYLREALDELVETSQLAPVAKRP